MDKKITYILVVGARPNFMKAAPLCKEFEDNNVDYIIYHSGQHYDFELSRIFEEEFSLNPKRIHHQVREEDNAIKNIQETILAFKNFLALPKFAKRKDSLRVIVFGDVNTSCACALAAKQAGITLIHMEAGLRSFDITMPEELNRITIDNLSDYLFTTSFGADENLMTEGIYENVSMCGNLMIDTLKKFQELTKFQKISDAININGEKKKLIVVTLHRPSNVDNHSRLCEIIEQLQTLSRSYNVVIPMHPRLRKQIREFALIDRFKDLHIADPLGYLNFLTLLQNASVVITDSGGIQEETTYLKIPCLTVRKSTERPITIELGTNQLVEPKDICTAIINLNKRKPPLIPPLWDGMAAKRIFGKLKEFSKK